MPLVTYYHAIPNSSIYVGKDGVSIRREFSGGYLDVDPEKEPLVYAELESLADKPGTMISKKQSDAQADPQIAQAAEQIKAKAANIAAIVGKQQG